MNIYVIAGPPGIGKSTEGYRYLPAKTPIIDHDLAAYQYRKTGFLDYKFLAQLKTDELIKEYVLKERDFAIELNLGFASHYDYLKSIWNINRNNKIYLILFFTDEISLCLNTAKIRHEMGGHLVSPQIIEEMYSETFPLLLENQNIFESFRFINVVNSVSEEVDRRNIPNWLTKTEFSKYV